MHIVDVDVADADDVIVDDVEGGLQGMDTHTPPYAVDLDDVGNYAHADIDGVGNAEINVDVDDVGNFDDVDGGLQGMNTHTAICCRICMAKGGRESKMPGYGRLLISPFPIAGD